MKLSVVIITKNEEKNLARCLDSVSFADEIVLVDSHSTDRTTEIAESYGARVSQIEWQGYGRAKQSAVDQARGEWVLSIDADEELSFELAEEIKTLLSGQPGKDGYTVCRRTNFLGRWIKHSGWYPDRVIRLFKRSHGNFNRAVIHEEVLINGSVGQLAHDMNHFSYPDLESYFVRSNRYSTVGAEQAYDAGRRFKLSDLVLKPVAAFSKCYISGLGFLDGIEGFMIASLSAHAVFAKYCKLRHLERQNYNRNEKKEFTGLK